mmetsp:Transcript_104640/g.197122  ORF Transcript_104640/g.197122 Transcript_104640/m.197122 type:complete len:98 (+) Transcript_104640:452-745(+)
MLSSLRAGCIGLSFISGKAFVNTGAGLFFDELLLLPPPPRRRRRELLLVLLLLRLRLRLERDRERTIRAPPSTFTQPPPAEELALPAPCTTCEGCPT